MARTTATEAELEAALEHIRSSPRDSGSVELIARRPAPEQREVLDVGELDRTGGLVGDDWVRRPNRKDPEGGPNPETQLTLMNARLIAAIAGDIEHWPLAGDQFYVDLDLGVDNLPVGSRLTIGDATIEISPVPHTGCKKFVARFGMDAMRFISSPLGQELRLRGVNAKVIAGGTVRRGDRIRRIGG